MQLNITPKEQIEIELQEIQDFCDITMSEDAQEAHERGNVLSAYISRTAKLLADAKYHKDEILKSEMISEITRIISLSPSVATKFIETLTKEENYLFLWAERIHRTCVHQLEWCRTVISKAKAEMQAFGK
ncbi:hypothetical protein [Myroides odoratimimus]|uniref:hypothetical protein n=1 Tax=Myroides odoratimimus TaxID=76832 RepID=UPI0004A7CD81|nr:hypothetical protein [Myroides odoratimimus]MDM1396089.1 hypothetical protein [Myroides odoratimimus]